MRFAPGWGKSLVTVAHEAVSSPAEWLARVTDHLAGSVDGLGVAGRLVSVEPRAAPLGYVIRSGRQVLVDALREQEALSEHRVDFLMRGAKKGLRAVESGRGVLRDPYLKDMRRRLRGAGMGNMFHWTLLHGGLCATVGLLVRPGEGLDAAPQAVQRVGEQLAVTFELACRATALGEVSSGLPTGRLPNLRANVRARADTGHSRTEVDASEVWEGLMRGTWSVVDRHDHQGRRYIVAHRRPPGALPDPRSLSPKEAQVVALAASGHADKWIAYELGIARSTVATHLQKALEKLSIGSRVELVRAYRAEPDEPRTSSPPRLARARLCGQNSGQSLLSSGGQSPPCPPVPGSPP